jgi:hypothetical protein
MMLFKKILDPYVASSTSKESIGLHVLAQESREDRFHVKIARPGGLVLRG